MCPLEKRVKCSKKVGSFRTRYSGGIPVGEELAKILLLACCYQEGPRDVRVGMEGPAVMAALFDAVTGHFAESADGRHYAARADVELGAERGRTVPFAVVGEACEDVEQRYHAVIVRLGPSGSLADTRRWLSRPPQSQPPVTRYWRRNWPPGIARVKSAKVDRRQVRAGGAPFKGSRTRTRGTSPPPRGGAPAPSSPCCSAVRCAAARWRCSPMGAFRADSRCRRRSPHGTRTRRTKYQTAETTRPYPIHCGFLAVPSNTSDVLKRSSRPVTATCFVFARSAPSCVSVKGLNVRAASSACSSRSMVSHPLITTVVGRLSA